MSFPKLKSRHKAIKGLNSILSAMQVVTTVRMQQLKMRQAQAQKYLDIAQEILAGQLKEEVTDKKRLVVFTATKGLCGGFDHDLLPVTERFLKENPGAEVLTLTQPGLLTIRAKGVRVIDYGPNFPGFDKLDFAVATRLADRLITEGTEVFIAYNQYSGSAKVKPNLYKLGPVPQELNTQRAAPEMLIEPVPEETLSALSRHYQRARFYQLVLNSYLAELTARLIVLKSAVDNSSDLIEKLEIMINKMRQASITSELTEVISSAESIRGDVNE